MIDGVTFEERRVGPGELEPGEIFEHRLILHYNGPVTVEVLQGGCYVDLEKRPGHLTLIPAGTTFGVRWRTEIHHLEAVLAPELVAKVAAEVTVGRATALVERYGIDDPHARHLLLAVRADVEEGHPSGRLYTETLIRALALRLVAGYADDRRVIVAPIAVRRVRDYIEAHLADNPSLAELATVSGLSPHHLTRTFARATGLPPHRYLLARRLERAKSLLAGTRRPIVEIAFDLGFGSQGHFHRAFRKYAGITPGSYRRGG